MNLYRIYKGKIENQLNSQLSRFEDKQLKVLKEISFKYFANKYLKLRLQKQDKETSNTFSKISHSLQKKGKEFLLIKQFYQIYYNHKKNFKQELTT